MVSVWSWYSLGRSRLMICTVKLCELDTEWDFTAKSWCLFYPKYHRREHTAWQHRPLTTLIDWEHLPKKSVYVKACLFIFGVKKIIREWQEVHLNKYESSTLLCTHSTYICSGSSHWFDYTTLASSFSQSFFCTNPSLWSSQLILNAQCSLCIYNTVHNVYHNSAAA